jgi:HlyD family secretion protein
MSLRPFALFAAAALALAPAAGPAADARAAAAASASGEAVQLPAVTVVTAAPARLRDRVLASGLIGPVEEVHVQPQIEGQAIEALLADVGDRVQAGQVLARLSSAALDLQMSQLGASRAAAGAGIAQAEAALVEARAAADEAVRVRDRTQQLRAQGAATQAAADQAAAQATAAEARVAVAEQALAAAKAQAAVIDAQIADVELNLRRTLVSAPVAGEITARNAVLGAIASAAGPPMFVITRDGLLELRADVAEADVLRLAAGQPARLTVVGRTAPVAGQVRLVEPAVDPLTRLGRVRIRIDDPAEVRAGLFAEAEILVAERVALALPVTAVASTGPGRGAVHRVDDTGLVTRVEVETGIRDGGLIEIVAGLSEGDRVVARAGAFVRPGDRINPVLDGTRAEAAD